MNKQKVINIIFCTWDLNFVSIPYYNYYKGNIYCGINLETQEITFTYIPPTSICNDISIEVTKNWERSP